MRAGEGRDLAGIDSTSNTQFDNPERATVSSRLNPYMTAPTISFSMSFYFISFLVCRVPRSDNSHDFILVQTIENNRERSWLEACSTIPSQTCTHQMVVQAPVTGHDRYNSTRIE
jgi:hypothetical protein